MFGLGLKATILAVTTVCVIVGGGVYVTVQQGINKEVESQQAAIRIERANKQLWNNADTIKIETGVPRQVEGISVQIEEDLYDYMHDMINTKIIANEIRNEREITPELCEKLIEIAEKRKDGDMLQLVSYLDAWKVGDFSDGVAQHNYLLDRLNANDFGEATGLREGVEVKQ